MKRLFALGLLLCLLAGCAKGDTADRSAAAEALANVPRVFSLAAPDTVSLTPPEGFAASDDGLAYYAPGYPGDGSSILLHTADTDPLFDTYTPELVLATLKSTYLNTLGVEPDVVMDTFAFTTLCGFRTLRMQYHFAYQGIPMTCLQYVVEADAAYTFSFIQVGEANWLSAYETSADTIHLSWAVLGPPPSEPVDGA